MSGIDEPVRMSIMPKMDVNGDGSSTMDDVYAMSATWLLHNGDTNFDDRADLNHDGVVNNIDADILAGNWKVVLQNAVRYYYHFDGLGSVVALSDKDGETVETYQYSVFGDTAVYNAAGTRLAASAVGNVYFFTARRLDTETGIYYYRARMYAPHLGRFLQTDPIGYEDSMCLYQYCLNNPVIFVDPSGEGLYKWLYTGDWNASDEVYIAATEKAAAVAVQWGVENYKAHKKAVTVAAHVITVAAAEVSSYVPLLSKTAAEKGVGFGPKNLLSDKTTPLSRAAKKTGSKSLRNLARQTKNARYATAAKIAGTAALVVEAGVGIYSGYKANQSDGFHTFSDGSMYDPLGEYSHSDFMNENSFSDSNYGGLK